MNKLACLLLHGRPKLIRYVCSGVNVQTFTFDIACHFECVKCATEHVETYAIDLRKIRNFSYIQKLPDYVQKVIYQEYEYKERNLKCPKP